MADLKYNKKKFDDLSNDLDYNIGKIKNELYRFDEIYNKIKANWSGTEFEKANAKLLEMRATLERTLEDERKQKSNLDKKNDGFGNNTVRL